MSLRWSGDKELQDRLKLMQAKSSKAAAGAITGLVYDVRQEVKTTLPKWLRLTRQFLPNSVIYERLTRRT